MNPVSQRPSVWSSVIGALVLALAPVAKGQIGIGYTVGLTFTGVSPGTSVTMSAGGTNYGPGPSAGVYSFTASGNPAFVSPFQTFCLEISQFTNASTQTYTVVNLASASANSLDDNIAAAGIGATRARNLQILYYNAFGPTFEATDFSTFFVNQVGTTADQKKAAFQFAVWELAHETDGNAFDLTAGGFKITSPVLPAAEVAFANTLLSGVAAILASDAATIAASQLQLLALHHGTYQDQIVPIPEPEFVAALMGALCLGTVWLRRRATAQAA